MNVIKISQTGINAISNTDPSNFLIYIDQSTDHVLVKEERRATTSITAYGSQTISHSLGYFPFNAQMVEVSSGEFQWVYNTPGASFNPFYSYVTTSNLFISNQDSSTKSFTYIIYYDVI